MTQNDKTISVVPEISPAGNELPHAPAHQDTVASAAAQGPAPAVTQDSAMPAPTGEALSSAEVARMTGGESVQSAVNQALENAEDREDTSQS